MIPRNAPHADRPALASALALATILLVPLVATGAALEAQEETADEETAAEQIERQEPLARVGLTEDFTAVLDSAPEAADWELLRQTIALRWEPGMNEDLEAGTRRHLVLHAAVIEEGEIREHHTTDPLELLPGGTKLDPEGGFLPEESMIPDGHRIANVMALGEIEVEPGEIMTDLVRDIIADMTQDTPALYIAPTLPEENADQPHAIHPVLIQLTAS